MTIGAPRARHDRQGSCHANEGGSSPCGEGCRYPLDVSDAPDRADLCATRSSSRSRARRRARGSAEVDRGITGRAARIQRSMRLCRALGSETSSRAATGCNPPRPQRRPTSDPPFVDDLPRRPSSRVLASSLAHQGARPLRDAARSPREESAALRAQRVFKFPRSRTMKPLRFERTGRRLRRTQARMPPRVEESIGDGLFLASFQAESWMPGSRVAID